jgi:putative ABC transport system substrate-binding protein
MELMPRLDRAATALLLALTAILPQAHAEPYGGNSSDSSDVTMPAVVIHRDALLLAQADPARRGRDDGIAVLYPDIGEPYRKVFTEIIDGIERQTRVPVRGYPIVDHADLADLQAALKRNGSKVIIALGRQGVKAAAGLSGMPVIVGGVSSVPEADKLNGISLTPDPNLLFARLKSLLPAIKRVIVVYNPQNSEQLIRLAREAARAQGLELVALEAADLATAVRRYEAAFAGADSRLDALWLPQDATTVDESTILPLVLRESWDRNLPIFSSSILHVKKGALFALFPNNTELGRDLANLATAVLGGEPPKHGVTPLRAVRTAFNWRTANHIGLNMDANQQRSFDFLYPEP